MFGCILALHSIVSVLSCVTVCWFRCTCSGFTANCNKWRLLYNNQT